MNRHSLAILCRYRDFLLEGEQIALQEKMFEEREHQNTCHELEFRIKEAHAAKVNAQEVAELIRTDQGAAFLQTRKVVASRMLDLARHNSEEAMAKTIQAKCERDQMRFLMEKDRQDRAREREEGERRVLDDLVTSRFSVTRSES